MKWKRLSSVLSFNLEGQVQGHTEYFKWVSLFYFIGCHLKMWFSREMCLICQVYIVVIIEYYINTQNNFSCISYILTRTILILVGWMNSRSCLGRLDVTLILPWMAICEPNLSSVGWIWLALVNWMNPSSYFGWLHATLISSWMVGPKLGWHDLTLILCWLTGLVSHLALLLILIFLWLPGWIFVLALVDWIKSPSCLGRPKLKWLTLTLRLLSQSRNVV